MNSLPRENSEVERWSARRKRERQWEHDLNRYVTIGRRADRLRAVWDAAKGHRISRWLTPANAEHECPHGRLSHDRTLACGCWPGELASVVALPERQLELGVRAA